MVEGIDPVRYREHAVEELQLKHRSEAQRRHFEPEVDPYSYTEILREPIPGVANPVAAAHFRVRKLCLGFWQQVVTPEIQLLRQATTGGLSGVARLLGQEFVQAPNGTTAEAFYMAYRGLDLEQWYAVCRKEKPIHFHPFGDAGFWLQLIYTILDRVLYPFHAVGFVHCDFKPDNVCIPFSEVHIEGDDITGYLDIGSVSLIDLGASVGPMDDAQGKRPHTGIVVAAQGDDHPLRYVSDYYVQTRESALQALDGRADLYSLAYWLRDFLLDGAEGSGPWPRARLKEAIRGDDTQRKALAALPGLIWDAADQYGQREPHPHPSLIASIRKVHIHSHDRIMFRVPLRLAERKHHMAPGWSVLKGYRKDVHLQSDASETVVAGAAPTVAAGSVLQKGLDETKLVLDEGQRSSAKHASETVISPVAKTRGDANPGDSTSNSGHAYSQAKRRATTASSAEDSKPIEPILVSLQEMLPAASPRTHRWNWLTVSRWGLLLLMFLITVVSAMLLVWMQLPRMKPSATTTTATRNHPEANRGQPFSKASSGQGELSCTPPAPWTTAGEVTSNVLRWHLTDVTSVAFSPDGRRLLSGAWSKTPMMWDAETGERLRYFIGHEGRAWSVAFSPDGRRLLSGSSDKTLRLWDAETGKALRVLRGHEDYVESVAFSPDGRRLLSGSVDKTLRLWDTETGESLRVFRGHENNVNSVAFSPDGRRLLSGSADKTLRLWDAEAGETLRELRGHEGAVMSVAFSPDGRRLLSGSYDKTLRLWDAETGEPLRVLRGHGDLVYSVAFSPDGSRMLSGSKDKTLRLWNAETGEPLRVLRGHGDLVYSVAFSPDGRRLLSGYDNGALQLWDDPGRTACADVPTKLR